MYFIIRNKNHTFSLLGKGYDVNYIRIIKPVLRNKKYHLFKKERFAFPYHSLYNFCYTFSPEKDMLFVGYMKQ